MTRMIAAAIGSSRSLAVIPVPLRCRTSTRSSSLAKCIVVACLVVCRFASAPAWAIDCLSAPGDAKSGWYSWRQIDGRKCWFKKTGAMPAKSQLHWSVKAQESSQETPQETPQEKPQVEPQQEPQPATAVSPSQERTGSVAALPPAAPPPQPVESRRATAPRVTTIPVSPVPVSSARLGSGPVDLMKGEKLSAVPVFGSPRPRAGRPKSPAMSPASADPFDARFTGQGH